MNDAMLQKGALSQMLQEIKCSVNQTQNRHKFLLISSTKYEILLASWPLAVALMYAVAMLYAVAMCIKMPDSSSFCSDEMSWLSTWETLCTASF